MTWGGRGRKRKVQTIKNALRKKTGGAEYCEPCEMWLNGPTQMEDHKNGKKHKKNLRKPKNVQSAKKVENKTQDKELTGHERENLPKKVIPAHTENQQVQWPSKRPQHTNSCQPRIHPEQQRMQQQWCPSVMEWWEDLAQQPPMCTNNQQWWDATWHQQTRTTWHVSTEMQQMPPQWAECSSSNYSMQVQDMQ